MPLKRDTPPRDPPIDTVVVQSFHVDGLRPDQTPSVTLDVVAGFQRPDGSWEWRTSKIVQLSGDEALAWMKAHGQVYAGVKRASYDLVKEKLGEKGQVE